MPQMTDEEFELFLSSAMDELWEKQDRLEINFGFGSYPSWFFDQTKELLELRDETGKNILIAEVVVVGSYAANSNSWKWAWSNDSLTPSIREKSAALKELKLLTGIDLFDREFPVSIDDENMSWELAAMATKKLGAMGIYKAPSSSQPLCTFLALSEIRRVQ